MIMNIPGDLASSPLQYLEIPQESSDNPESTNPAFDTLGVDLSSSAIPFDQQKVHFE